MKREPGRGYQGREGRSFATEETKRRWKKGERRGKDGMHRKRWQFIRVPGIVDTYYHAKYNMLTTSHNTAILSILLPYGRSANRVSSREPRVKNFIAEFGGRCSGSVALLFLADFIRQRGAEKGKSTARLLCFFEDANLIIISMNT